MRKTQEQRYERAVNNVNQVIVALQEIEAGETEATEEDIAILQGWQAGFQFQLAEIRQERIEA